MKIIGLIFLGLLCVITFTNASEVTGNLDTGMQTGMQGSVVNPPVASPVAGTYTSVQNVSLSASGATSIRYTKDGGTPSCSVGNIYSSPIFVNETITIKAIACYSSSASAVTNFVYTINIIISGSQTSSLLDNDILNPPSGSSNNSTPFLTSNQQITIDVPVTGGTSEIIIPADTTITSVGGGNFDATSLTAGVVASGTLSGLGTGAVVDGSLQWGIANLGLQFSPAITLKIYVGASFNGQTLTIMRSTSGSSGWTSDGVSPGTCVVADGICQFTATKASYYATYHTESSGGGGGGGGGGSYSPIIATIIYKSGDINKDNKVDKYDLALLMANWGSTGTSASDLNNDGKVDKYDLAILMANWS